MNTRWIKWPSPGEFRGEGKWWKFEDTELTEQDWNEIYESKFLPTHIGDNPPDETTQNQNTNTII